MWSVGSLVAAAVGTCLALAAGAGGAARERAPLIAFSGARTMVARLTAVGVPRRKRRRRWRHRRLRRAGPRRAVPEALPTHVPRRGLLGTALGTRRPPPVREPLRA